MLKDEIIKKINLKKSCKEKNTTIIKIINLIGKNSRMMKLKKPFKINK
jgi:hypothetical protein